MPSPLYARSRRHGRGRATGELAADLREIFAATTREQALATAGVVAARWELTHPAVARLLEDGTEECLACLAFPLAHRPASARRTAWSASAKKSSGVRGWCRSS